MLDAGQPGELPLMRELSALKKSKGLRDPSTTTSARKSPVLEAISSMTTEFNLPYQEGYDELMMRKQSGLGGSGRRDGFRCATPRKGLLRSPQQGDPNAKSNWEFPNEAVMDIDASQTDFHKQREELKHHLEKLGILGDKADLGKQMMGSKSLLHNWKPAATTANDDDDDDDNDYDDGDDYDEDADRPEVERAFAYEQEVSLDVRNWLDAAMDDANTHHGSAFQDEGLGFRRSKASQAASRMPKANRMSRKSAQTLSPLVLNSHEDMQKFCQSRSLFTLEEPYIEEEEEYFKEESENDLTSAHNAVAFKGASRSHSPIQTRRPSRKYMTMANVRHAHMHSDITSEAGRRSLRAGPQEDGFFEYDMASVEVPKKESGKSSHHRYRNHKPPKYYPAGQDAAMIPDSRKMARRKGGSMMERQVTLRQQFAPSAYMKNNAGAEPLPLLTELEDYNESEDCAASSVDDDGRKLNEGSYGRSLVRVEDKENLQLAFPECKELALCEYKPRNLSQKYRPRLFEEVIGQNIVTQALSNAILRGKIAPVYLFQGSRGTGKTSAARIFAAALICTSPERHPCGVCRECISVATGKCSEVREVDAASNNGIERVKILLEETISAPPLSRYKVFIIDECHVLSTETWNALLQILEEPPMNVVFILITTDPDRLPRTAVSRCQKFPFPKIKESEIVKRLQQLASLENFQIDLDTLQLIASRSDGSLRDAETTLDQLSLLGQEIDSSTVYELVGSASDERMLSLLDSALRADTVGTVRRARELVDSGVEPLSLMSRLATLITDILAGTFKFSENQRKGFFRKQTLSEEKLEWLRMAMKTLSDAEKQLRVSNDRTTWLTAALLQLGPDRSCMFPISCVGTSVTQSPVALDDIGENEAGDFEHMSSGRQTWDDDGNHGQNVSAEMTSSKLEINNGENRRHIPANHDTNWSAKRSNEMPSMKMQRKLTQDRFRASPRPQAPEKQAYDEDLSDDFMENTNSGQLLSSSKLDEIWCRVVERCQPLALRQLLHAHGRLISISMSEVDAVIHLEVSHPEHKAKCERSRKSIANVFKSVLGFPVEVKISLASLPAENESTTHNWMPVGNYSVKQDSKSGVVEPERPPVKGYSLSHWKHPGGGVSSATGPNPSEPFPAIPQPSFGSPVKDSQYLNQAATSWNSNNMRCAPTRGARTMEDDSHHAMVHDARKALSLMDNMSLEDARRRHFQGMPEGGDGHMRGLEYDDDIDSTYSDGERNMDEHELRSPEPHEEVDVRDMNRPRHGSVDGPLDTESYCVDGRRSCDADLQKRKGSSLKMVRRLTMRSRTRSLPSSNPNSPDDRGSSRFAMKTHANSQKSRDAHHSGEEEAGDYAEASNMVASQKKSKLKGAAGSFARFFKGSK